MNNFHRFQNLTEFSAIFKFVFANLIEKETHVTLIWNLSRNPEKVSSKFRKKNAKFDEENEKIRNSIFNREKMLAIFG